MRGIAVLLLTALSAGCAAHVQRMADARTAFGRGDLEAANRLIAAEHERLTSNVHLRLALRAYAPGRLAVGREAFDAAVQLDPGLLARPSELAAALYEASRRMPVDLEPYAATVFANLPERAAVLRP